MGYGLVDGPIGQLALSLGKIVTLIQDDCGAAIIGREDKDVGIGAYGAVSRTFRVAGVWLLRESGGVGIVGEDVGNVTFDWVVREELGCSEELGGLNLEILPQFSLINNYKDLFYSRSLLR